MIGAIKIGLVFIIYIFTTINGDKELCSIYDEECILQIGQTVYPNMVAGYPVVEPSDPLHEEEIIISLPRFSYKLYNATMKGLKDAVLKYEKFHRNGTLSFNIEIPTTHIEAYYELHGQLGDMVLNGKGDCRLSYNKHKINNVGKYFTSQDMIDKKTRNYITDFIFYSDVQGEATYKYENLKNRDKELAEIELRQLDDVIHSHVITQFMQKHIENIDEYLRIVPFSDLLAKPN